MSWLNRRPTSAEPRPGVRNDRLRDALATWAGHKDGRTFADVLRRAVTGELLLDITDSTLADPGSGLRPGDTLAISSVVDDVGRSLLTAFTVQDELDRMRGVVGTSLVQPAAAVLAQALRDHEGIAIDGRSDGMFIAYAEEIRQHLTPEPEAVAPLGTATATRSLPFPAYVEALAEGPLFVPETEATSTDPEGRPHVVVGTSPAEIWAWRPGGGVHGATLAEIADAVLRAGYAGIVVNPAQPAAVVRAEVLRGAVR